MATVDPRRRAADDGEGVGVAGEGDGGELASFCSYIVCLVTGETGRRGRVGGLCEASWGSRKTLRPRRGVGGSLLCSAFSFSTCRKKTEPEMKLPSLHQQFEHVWNVLLSLSKLRTYLHSEDDDNTVVSRRSELNRSSQVAAALRKASCRRISCSTSSTLPPSSLLLINGS